MAGIAQITVCDDLNDDSNITVIDLVDRKLPIWSEMVRISLKIKFSLLWMINLVVIGISLLSSWILGYNVK